MSAAERAMRIDCREDFEHYARVALRIRTKKGAIEELDLNSAQRFIHERLQGQLASTGRVRALVLKGRQQGCSTYVEARFYHRTTHAPGTRAYILTHHADATSNLFGMAERYHEHCPPLLKPSTGAANAKELYFDAMDSGYKVGTAGTKAVGRSDTIQLFHGSEVAYWPNADDHLAGIMQAVPDEDGTEIILESTSNGSRGVFYQKCMDAKAGKSDYELIFVPWFWQTEYRSEPRPDFKRSGDEESLAEMYGLDDEQIAWRRKKIVELQSVYKFRREYPNSPDEAFTQEMPGALWTRAGVDATRVETYPPLAREVVAVDPPAKGQTECGIVSAGITPTRDVYGTQDRSTAGTPEIWGAAVVNLFIERNADLIVYESNQGGDMVKSVITTAWRKIKGDQSEPPIRGVHASKNKQARAEPISILWTESGGFRGHIVGRLVRLEDELCGWEPLSGMESPNRLDAFVWAMTELTQSTTAQAAPVDLGEGSRWT